MTKKELFVGNLSKEVSKRDVEEAFDKYGRLLRCELKSKLAGACYCFLEFEDARDAEDALKNENGKDIRGSSMVVEWAKGKSDRRDDRRGGDRYGDRRYGNNRGFNGRNGDRNGAPRSLECFNCGESGHFARDCRKSGGNNGRRGDRNNGSSNRRPPRKESNSRSRSRSRSR